MSMYRWEKKPRRKRCGRCRVLFHGHQPDRLNVYALCDSCLFQIPLIPGEVEESA